jgi:hypothetical protein
MMQQLVRVRLWSGYRNIKPIPVRGSDLAKKRVIEEVRSRKKPRKAVGPRRSIHRSNYWAAQTLARKLGQSGPVCAWGGWFSRGRGGKKEKRGGTVLIASGDRDTFQLASDRTTILYPVRAGEMARIDPAEVRARYGVDPFRILSLRAAILQTSCRAHRELAQLVLQHCCKDTARLKPRSLPAAFPHRLRTCGFTDQSQRWIKKLRCRAFAAKSQPGARLPRWRESGSWINSPAASKSLVRVAPMASARRGVFDSILDDHWVLRGLADVTTPDELVRFEP